MNPAHDLRFVESLKSKWLINGCPVQKSDHMHSRPCIPSIYTSTPCRGVNKTCRKGRGEGYERADKCIIWVSFLCWLCLNTSWNWYWYMRFLPTTSEYCLHPWLSQVAWQTRLDNLSIIWWISSLLAHNTKWNPMRILLKWNIKKNIDASKQIILIKKNRNYFEFISHIINASYDKKYICNRMNIMCIF